MQRGGVSLSRSNSTHLVVGFVAETRVTRSHRAGPHRHDEALGRVTPHAQAVSLSSPMKCAMLDVASSKSGSTTRGYVVETTDVDHFQLPDVALQPGNLRLAVAVTHHCAEGAAWEQYVIFLVGVGDHVPQGMEAKGERGPSAR